MLLEFLQYSSDEVLVLLSMCLFRFFLSFLYVHCHFVYVDGEP